MILLFSDLEHYSDADFELDLQQISSQRFEKVSRLRFGDDKKSSLKAYILLKNGLKEHFDLDIIPEFVFSSCGRPALAGYPDIHFSLSHTRGAALCVIDTRPVGADIERIKTVDPALIQAVCDPEQQKEILDSPFREKAFARCWTRKESYLKLLGCGITDRDQLMKTRTDDHDGYVFETNEDPSGLFVYSVCRRITE